jgi:hypothetical protein
MSPARRAVPRWVDALDVPVEILDPGEPAPKGPGSGEPATTEALHAGQPRDYHGRWKGKGGGPKAGKPGTGEHEAEPGSNTPLGSPWNGSDVKVPKDMNNETYQQVTSALDKLSKDYTHPVNDVLWGEPGEAEKSAAYTYPDRFPHAIYINKQWQDEPAAIKADMSDGHAVARDLGETITHEYGHLLDFQLSGNNPDDWTKMTKKLDRAARDDGVPSQLAAAGISPYAASNPTESIAEAFASYRTKRISPVSETELISGGFPAATRQQMKKGARDWARIVGSTFDEQFGVKTYEQEPLPTASAFEQARDWHGRWVGKGGGPGGAVTHAGGWDPEQTTMPDGMNPMLQMEVRGTLGKLADDYTVPIRRIKWNIPSEDVDGTFAYSDDREPGVIHVSKRWETDYAGTAAAAGDGHGVPHNLGDVITHEYAHGVDNKLVNEHPEAWADMYGKLAERARAHGTDSYFASAEISTYATGDPKEASAEAFTAYRTGHRAPTRYGPFGEEEETAAFKKEKAGADAAAAEWVQVVGSTYDQYYGAKPATSSGYSAWYRPPGEWNRHIETFHLPGQHNQADHGRHGVRGLMARTTKGGFTYSVTNASHVKSGYALSPYPERSEVHDTKDMSSSVIKTYRDKNADLLGKPDHYLGAWRERAEEGKIDRVWLDVSIVKGSKAEAVAVGKEHNQIAMYDLAKGEEIPLGGSGA